MYTWMCSWGPQFGLWFEYIIELNAIIFFKDNCSSWYIIILYTNHMNSEGLEMRLQLLLQLGLVGWRQTLSHVNYLLEIVISFFLASFLVFWASLSCLVPWYADENTIELLVDTSLLGTWPINCDVIFWGSVAQERFFLSSFKPLGKVGNLWRYAYLVSTFHGNQESDV